MENTVTNHIKKYVDRNSKFIKLSFARTGITFDLPHLRDIPFVIIEKLSSNSISHVFLSYAWYFISSKESRKQVIRIARECKSLEVLEFCSCFPDIEDVDFQLMVMVISMKCKMLKRLCFWAWSISQLRFEFTNQSKLKKFFAKCTAIQKIEIKSNDQKDANIICR